MVLVQPSEADRALLKKVTQEAVLPKWAARCSAQCVRTSTPPSARRWA